MESRTKKKTYEGVVVSNKMDKTVVVRIERSVRHAKYGKLMTRFKKFYAHDETNEIKEGQKVVIMECRPLSRLKRFRVMEVQPATSSEQ